MALLNYIFGKKSTVFSKFFKKISKYTIYCVVFAEIRKKTQAANFYKRKFPLFIYENLFIKLTGAANVADAVKQYYLAYACARAREKESRGNFPRQSVLFVIYDFFAIRAS